MGQTIGGVHGLIKRDGLLHEDAAEKQWRAHYQMAGRLRDRGVILLPDGCC